MMHHNSRSTFHVDLFLKAYQGLVAITFAVDVVALNGPQIKGTNCKFISSYTTIKVIASYKLTVTLLKSTVKTTSMLFFFVKARQVNELKTLKICVITPSTMFKDLLHNKTVLFTSSVNICDGPSMVFHINLIVKAYTGSQWS